MPTSIVMNGLVLLKHTFRVRIDYRVPLSKRLEALGKDFDIDPALNDEAFPLMQPASVCNTTLGFAQIEQDRTLTFDEILNELHAHRLPPAYPEELFGACNVETFSPIEFPAIATGRRKGHESKFWFAAYARFRPDGVKGLGVNTGPFTEGSLILIAKKREWLGK